WLDDLWVEPKWIGTRIGSRLFRHAAGRGEQLGASRMEWEAEPNAIGFYEKLGGRYVRDGSRAVGAGSSRCWASPSVRRRRRGGNRARGPARRRRGATAALALGAC